MNEQEKSRLLSVSRREVKYLLSFTDRLYVLDALDRLLTPDAYGGYNGYTVRSVYFDSMVNEDYLDKKKHADEKKRIRLRVYHPDDQTAKFELKRKSYGQELKESIVVRREDAQEILKQNYEVLFHYDLFSHRLNFKKAMHDDLTILEIKYDRFLFKQIQDVLSHCDLTRKPPSKFGTSRELLKLYYH